MKRETHVLAVLLSAICMSAFAFEPNAATAPTRTVALPTPSPRKRVTPRPIQSPVTKRTSANTNFGTGNQVEAERTQSTPSAVRSRTETVDKDETITIHQRSTPTTGNQSGGQNNINTGTANRTGRTPKSFQIEVDGCSGGCPSVTQRTPSSKRSVQSSSRATTTVRTPQPRGAKKNQDIEVENDETHVVRPSTKGSNSAPPTLNSTQCAANKNCQEFEAVRNTRTLNGTSIPATNVKSGKISTKRSKPRKP